MGCPQRTAGMGISSTSILRTLTLVFVTCGCLVISSNSLTAGTPVSSLLTPPNHENTGDGMALLAFRSSIVSDPNSVLSSWNDSSHFCRWPGIMCGRRHPNRVVRVELNSLGLSGLVHRSLANLTFLSFLNLSDNNFYGHIPEELCPNLLRLQDLDLSFNQLEGEIPISLGHCRAIQNIILGVNSLQGTIPPSLGNLSNLLLLDLTNNSLSGGIPPQLGSISTLKVLVLQGNNLSGIIPDSFGNISALEVLALNLNNLSGNIPPSIGKFKSSLYFFHLWGNRLTGTVPASIYNLSSLNYIDLASNRFSGRLPSDLGDVFPKVVEFLVDDNKFIGPIPSSIGNASLLNRIQFSRNSFSGSIPPSIGNLGSSLFFLHLMENKLNGTLPASIYNLSSIRVLELSSNSLSGHLPSDLGFVFPVIEEFSVVTNQFRGPIPPSIGNASSLRAFKIDFNSFTGSIPASVGKLGSSLSWFSVANNRLTSMVPTSLYNLSSIIHLDLANNSLSGHLPSDLGSKLPLLDTFSVFLNGFSGPIPPTIGNASSLRIFQLAGNAFSGNVPPAFGTLRNLDFLQLGYNQLSTKQEGDWDFVASLGNCTHLKTLDLSSNKLQGMLPLSISNLSKGLENLLISDNQIHGNIPEGIGNLVGLTKIDLSNNILNGAIPSTIGRLKTISIIAFASNRLQGEIPSSMCYLDRLISLNLSSNQLNGAIPLCLGVLQKLQRLYLSDNSLGGVIPKELTSIAGLTILELARNSLSGSLPKDIGRFKNLNRLDISSNYLSDEIPINLGDCQVLVYLNISRNNFRGAIPSSFKGLRGIEFLDMSRNNMSGSIPRFFQDFVNLKYLNLSSNNFDGEVPSSGIFQNMSAFFILENPMLCGGNSQLHLSPCSMKTKSNRHHTKKLRATIAISIATLCTTALVLCIVIILCYSKTKSGPSKEQSKEILPRITYSELNIATNKFSPHNLIGTGSFANVYRGELGSITLGRKIVAVKVIKLQQHAASKSFMRECETLKNIRHRNLVKILSSCSSVDFQGNDFKALVFEFMSNGSLEGWLHPDEKNHNYGKYLNLEQRLNIMVDVAFAINYLHCQNPKPIAHCDLKPSNVLLDEDMIAHVSDFGIAKFLQYHDESESKNQNMHSSSTFKGSIGYVAPEYGMGRNASTEGDIYSYGILLLETVTGRRPTDALFTGDLTLNKFVEALFPERILDIVDRRLLIRELGTENVNMYDGTSVENDQISTSKDYSYMTNKEDARYVCLASLLRLGLACSKDLLQERIPIDIVTKELITIKETFLRAIDPREETRRCRQRS